MAKTDCNMQPPKYGRSDDLTQSRLKYLNFVVVVCLHVLMITSKLYGVAKERSGPLKPGIGIVEDSVRTIIGPLYAKSHHYPLQLLKFLDRKVDGSMNKLQSCIPSSLRRASFKAFNHARRAPIAAHCVMADVKKTGMVETASGLAKKVYAKYKPVAKDFYTKSEIVTEEYAIYLWRVFNQYTLFQKAAQTACPIACYFSDMYNQKVQVAAKNGYTVASHLPIIPVQRIAEALRTDNMKPIVIDGANADEITA